MKSYISKECQLCGSKNHRDLFSNIDVQTITSDGNSSIRKLKKYECLECGLVREGQDFTFDTLEEHYVNNYTVNTKEGREEHVFFRDGKPVPRNLAILNEIVEMLENLGISNFDSVFEIGAGQGNLIRYMRDFWQNKTIDGVELSQDAINIAEQSGIFLKHGDETQMPQNTDLAIAITVFEHVPEPRNFLTNIFDKLSANGHLILIQPVQNNISYDILYTDHLHHFNERHVEWFANQAGFEQIGLKLDTWFASCLSIHVFRKAEFPIQPKVVYIKQNYIQESLDYWFEIFSNLDSKLSELVGKKLAVYGMSEILGLLHHFTKLNEFQVICGIDDFPERHLKNKLQVPVYNSQSITEEMARSIDYCILSANAIYYPKLIDNCNRLGIKYISLV